TGCQLATSHPIGGAEQHQSDDAEAIRREPEPASFGDDRDGRHRDADLEQRGRAGQPMMAVLMPGSGSEQSVALLFLFSRFLLQYALRVGIFLGVLAICLRRGSASGGCN